MRISKFILSAFILSAMSSTAFADDKAFHAGAVITEFGKVATIDSDMKIPRRAKFKVLFDTATGADAGQVNRTLNSAARFLNMHEEAGVSEAHMKIAVVFHGKGSFDLTTSSFYSGKFDGAENGNKELIKALTNKGVRIILCGQTAAYYNITKDDLLPGVEMALSAMTAHALLQQDGYTLNPF